MISYWQVEAVPTQATRLFVHLLDDADVIQAQDYHWDNLDPQSLWFPHWQRGDLMMQVHDFQVDLGEVTAVRIGLFNPYTCEPGPCQNLLTNDGNSFCHAANIPIIYHSKWPD